MPVPVIRPFKIKRYLNSLLLTGLIATGFKQAEDAPLVISWANRALNECYDPTADAKLKKWEISVNDALFVRLRKTYTNGKQEYYSLQLKRLSDITYLGTSEKGILALTTTADDIIMQTYNDRKGDVDMMVNSLEVPVRNMEPARLDSIRNALFLLRDGK